MACIFQILIAHFYFFFIRFKSDDKLTNRVVNIYFDIYTREEGEDFIDAFISARGKGIQTFLYLQYDLCLLEQQNCQLTSYFCYKETEDVIEYGKGLILDGCRVKVKILFIFLSI